MLPSWYPTKENPHNGCFFREQALAMQKNFDFVVVTYKTKKVLAFIYAIKKIFNLVKPKVSFVQEDNGLKEYNLTIQSPQYIVWDLFLDRFNYVVKKTNFTSWNRKKENKSVRKAREKSISYIKKHNLLPHFDCVYSLTSQDMATLGNDFSKVFSVPHVTAEHAPFPWPGHVLTNYAVESIEKADAFLAISNDKIRQVLLQNVKVNPIWVGNLCDETKFKLVEKQNDVLTFLIVAANSFYKNYQLFVKTMEELKSIATKDFKIIIAGYNSNKGYSQNAKDLEALVQNSTIAKNTKMIEAVSRDNMPNLYNSCDVFVMTSIQEGLPVSALEASMSGLPVISTRCGGVEDYIDDSMGRIFPITDFKGLANACNQILNGEVKFDNKKIREKAVSLFGNEAFVERISKVFYDVIEK